MPDTPPRMVCEKLARVEKSGRCWLVIAGEFVTHEFSEEGAANLRRDRLNDWLDREVKKVSDDYGKDVDRLQCQVMSIPDLIEKAVDAERERCCEAVCMQCRSGAGVELIGGYWVHRAEECDDDMPCSAAAIRSAPGKEKS